MLNASTPDLYLFEIEADGLFDAIVQRLDAQLAELIVRLIESKTDDVFAASYERAVQGILRFAGTNAFAAADGMRARCPLCGGGPQSAYENANGFLLSLGLEKHLVGHQRAYECAVLAAARRRAARSCTL